MKNNQFSTTSNGSSELITKSVSSNNESSKTPQKDIKSPVLVKHQKMSSETLGTSNTSLRTSPPSSNRSITSNNQDKNESPNIKNRPAKQVL